MSQDKPKCSGKKWGVWSDIPCRKNATTEHEGKPYCKTHHPVLRAEKAKKRDERWRREWDERKALDQEKQRQAAEDARKLAAYPKLLDVCIFASRLIPEDISELRHRAQEALDAAGTKEG